ncbi:MAG: FtsK/SpoIIIE domain-containing protein [Chloroflexales bacterium]
MSPHDRYLLPLGWHTVLRPQPDLVHTALVGETNHVLISGASDCGKDNLAWWMLLSLALVHHDPAELQVCIIDGKGLDFQPWQDKAQTWALASDPEAIPATLRALTAERQRRRDILVAAGVSKWDHYQGGDLPLLVVFISELSLLETGLRRERVRRDRDRALDLDLESWLNTELTAGRAFGIRYLIGMQTVSGMEMRWRSQVGVFMGGYQPDESQVKPNTGKTATQIAAAGAVPPNLLPTPPAGAGVFTVVSGAQCATVRAPYLSDAERRRWLAHLPDRSVAAESPDPLLQRYLDTELEGAEPAPTAATSVLLPLTPAAIAAIGARIALGHTKTAVVRAMPGYDTRRHREFAAYYERIAADLAAQGLTARRARDAALVGITEV